MLDVDGDGQVSLAELRNTVQEAFAARECLSDTHTHTWAHIHMGTHTHIHTHERPAGRWDDEPCRPSAWQERCVLRYCVRVCVCVCVFACACVCVCVTYRHGSQGR